MRRNKLGINTFFGLSYFVFSLLGALIPDHSRNQGHLLNTSSAYRIEFSLRANPTGQVNPTGDNLFFAESTASGLGTSLFISSKPTKLPVQGTTLVPPTFPATGLSSVGTSGTFTSNFSCKPEIDNHTHIVCSGVPFQYNVLNGSDHYVPDGTTYRWIIVPGQSYNLSGVNSQTPGFQTSFTGTVPGKTIINTNSSGQREQIIYQVTPRSGSCTGADFFLTLIV